MSMTTEELRAKIDAGDYIPPDSLYENDREAYRRAQTQFHKEFRRDALAVVGAADHPKAEALWQLAHEEGHVMGQRQVLVYLEEFATLLSDPAPMVDVVFQGDDPLQGVAVRIDRGADSPERLTMALSELGQALTAARQLSQTHGLEPRLSHEVLDHLAGRLEAVSAVPMACTECNETVTVTGVTCPKCATAQVGDLPAPKDFLRVVQQAQRDTRLAPDAEGTVVAEECLQNYLGGMYRALLQALGRKGVDRE